MTYWWVNTNSESLPDDGRRPLDAGVVATYGPRDGFPDRASAGDRVFAFLSGVGVVGFGTVRDDDYETHAGSDAGFYSDETEHHVSVAWHYLLDSPDAVESSEAAATLGYDAPSFVGTYGEIDSETPEALVEEVRSRARTIARPDPDRSRPQTEAAGYYFDLSAIHAALWLFGDLRSAPTTDEAVPAAEGLVEYFCNWGPHREATHDSHAASVDLTSDRAEDVVDTWSSDISIALEDRCGVDVSPDTVAALGRELGLGTFPELTNDYLLNHLWDVSAHLDAIDPRSDEGPRNVVPVYDDLYGELPASFREYWQNKDTDGEPINRIRVAALDRHADGKLSPKAYEADEKRVNDDHDGDITTGWRPYTILGGVYYDFLKPRLRHHFEAVASELSSFADDGGLRTHVVDFMGPMQKLREFGWCCVYPDPDEGESHTDHYQLYVGFHHDYVKYGLHVGDDRRTSDWRSILDLERADRPTDELRWHRVRAKLASVKSEFDRLNEFGPGPRPDETPLDVTADPEVEISAADVEGLHFPETMATGLDDLLNQVRAALNAGNHVIFTGPPGTGKTELAEQVAAHLAAEHDDVYTGTHLTTATADWSTFETVGGYMPERDGDGELAFRPGQLLRRFKRDGRQRNDVTVIDEINRSDIDKAFGQLFTVLSGQSVQLPYETKQGNEILVRPARDDDAPDGDAGGDDESGGTDLSLEEYVVPDAWRLLATMNSYDKTSLYDMSYAFMRRFAFVRVDAPTVPGPDDTDPTPEEFAAGYLDAWDDVGVDPGDPVVAGLLGAWRVMNDHEYARSLGPAVARDMLAYVEQLPRGTKRQRRRAIADAVVAYAFPQLEGMVETRRESVLDELASLSRIDGDALDRAATEQFRR
ncbi:AAA family ATPase [Halorussus salinus]|uniref:AAA family ATPase n=1 Tax=Halorussus salinus TaxID=1364935 RepID=UPI001091F397|nr:MoxR family ATPase [Halorussus salinus]